MANLAKKNGIYLARFRFQDKEYKRSLKTTDRKAAEAAMHRVVFDNEAALRLMLASSIVRAAEGSAREGVPLRQNRRTPLIEAALAPARARIDKRTYARLRTALAMIFGPEAMVVARDVLQLDEKTARAAKSWAVRALVHAALEEHPSAPEAIRPKRRGG